MFYFKMLAALAVTAIVFLSCGKPPATAGNGSETDNAFSGRILYQDGSPAAGVTVRVLPVNNVPSIAVAKSIVITTDSNGYYNVTGLDSGLYNVEGLKDTLGVFIDSITVNAKPSIPDGILKKVGEVTGVTHMEGQTDTNQVRVTLYMPGTSRITKPVIGGRFNFENMPEGTYQLIIDPLPQYNVKVMPISVTAGQVLDLDTIRLGLYEPDTIDITTSTVYGTWGPNKTYRIFNDIRIAAGMSLAIKPNTNVLFMSYFGLSVNGTLYIEGKKDSFVTIGSGLANPTNRSWFGISSVSDTLIMRYCRVENVSNSIDNSGSLLDVRNCVFQNCRYPLTAQRGNSIIANNIFINNAGGIGLGTGRHSILNNIFYSISLAFQGNPASADIRYNDFFNVETVGIYGSGMSAWDVPPFTSNLNVDPDFIPGSDYQLSAASGCRGTGFKGMDIGIYDTLPPGVLERYIAVPNLHIGQDTIVFSGQTVTLTGSADDPLGTISDMAWDIGATGNFSSSQTGAVTLQAPPSFQVLPCLFSVIDDDGNRIVDTVHIYVLSDTTPAPPSGRMRPIVPGTFVDPAGDTAVITYPFWMDTTEVTQADYESVMLKNPSIVKGPRLPVTDVRIDEIVLYCNALSKLNNLDTVYSYYSITIDSLSGVDTLKGVQVHIDRNGFRLPTCDEWMLACMGGTGTVYYWRNPSETSNYACLAGFGYTQPLVVATLLPNPYGLYDMVGNVNEILWERSTQKPRFRVDYFAQVTTTCLFVGGSFNHEYADAQNPADILRYAKYSNLGFRCIRRAE